jgi:hypothetical protein
LNNLVEVRHQADGRGGRCRVNPRTQLVLARCAAMTAALGSSWVRIQDQLRQELGRDISNDPGS